jgi:3-deoxy-D-manno-octulosonic-acid transferase
LTYWIYRLLTGIVWLIAAPWQAITRLSRSEEWVERFGAVPPMPPGCIWVHAASVGEVAAAAPLVAELGRAGAAVMLTTVTRAGREVALRSVGESARVSFAPLDLPAAVNRALERVRPRALLLVETELWPTLIVEAARRSITVGVVNARLSDRSLARYKAPLSPVPHAARLLSFAACQTVRDRERFVALGLAESNVTVVGNAKYDVLPRPLGESQRSAVRSSLGLAPGSRAVVFGSVRPREEAAVVEAAGAILSQLPGTGIVIAPRHLKRVGPLAALMERSGIAYVRRSERRAELGDRVIILDSTGELPKVYAVADVAFVGGSLAPYGGHNPLEPAANGVPVVLGPHTDSCRESVEALTASGGGFVVSDPAELRERLLLLLRNEELRRQASEAAAGTVRAGAGATRRTVELLRAASVLGQGEVG